MAATLGSLALSALSGALELMPLTACLGNELLDATVDDLGLTNQGFSWADVYRRRPAAELSCRACSGRMTAKVSKLGTRFFAHHRRPEDCPVAGETAIHLELKALVAARARALEIQVEVEAPGVGWRADVLTIGPDGQRIAWEVQRSLIAPEDVAERMARHRASGVRTVWLAKRDWPWCAEAGALIVPDRRTADDPWLVEHGVCGWTPIEGLEGYGAEWLPRQCNLDMTIDLILRGGLSLELAYAWDEFWAKEKLRWVPRRALESWAASRGPMPAGLPAQLQLRWQRCYRCDRWTAAVVGIRPFNPSTGQWYEPISAQHEGVLARIREEMAGRITPGPTLPIGMIRERYSQAVGGSYLSNGCYWCGALLGNHFLYGLGAGHSYLTDDGEGQDEKWNRDRRLVIGPVRIERLRKMQRQARSVERAENSRKWI